jgi:hypothetical protein
VTVTIEELRKPHIKVLPLQRDVPPYSHVVRAWEGRTVVCIGGGPSLTARQVLATMWLPVIAINDAYRLADFADICYFADSRWGWHKDRPEFQLFSGQKCTIEWGAARVVDNSVHVLRYGGLAGVSRDPRSLCDGGHGGYQAINLAALAGAKTILLLGFDAREDSEKAHWFGDHIQQVPRRAFRAYRSSLRALAPELERDGVRVINCSPGSAVDAFEKMPLEDALSLLVA